MNKKRLFYTSVILFASLISYAFFFYIPIYEDKKRNSVKAHAPVTEQSIIDLHNRLFVADLHADTLLWDRSLTTRHQHGHIDLPRMQEGNIGLQVFSVVTKTPRNLNLFSNDDKTDNITLLAIAQRWPPKTWNSLFQRALFQAGKLQQAVTESDQRLAIIRSKKDLRQLIAARDAKNKMIGGVLSLEGGHALEGKLENVDALFTSGYRIIGFTHFFDNELGGSAHGLKKPGITQFGINVLQRMEQLGMLVDISHASPNLINEIFQHATKPVIATHTGVKDICNVSPRNLSDEHIHKIAKSGGVVGIGFWPAAICTQDVSGLVQTIRYVVDLVGDDYVALGSDFDGNVQTPFDIANINIVTLALSRNGFSELQIKKIMGNNITRILLKTLPED